MQFVRYEAPSLAPTGACSCDRSHHHYTDPRRDGRAEACCAKCYAHWWTDGARRPIEHSEPFSPYTYTLAAMGRIPAPPPTKPAPLGLLGRITHLNFWQTSLNPEYGGFAGDWEWHERLAVAEAKEVSSDFERQHVEGNDQALSEFLKRCPYALDQAWVTAQLVAWRVEGTADAMAKLGAALGAFTDNRGRGSARSGDLKRNILRNLVLIEAVHARIAKNFNTRAAISDTADEVGIGHESAREIYEAYERARRWHSEQRGREVSVSECVAWLRQIAARLPSGEE